MRSVLGNVKGMCLACGPGESALCHTFAIGFPQFNVQSGAASIAAQDARPNTREVHIVSLGILRVYFKISWHCAILNAVGVYSVEYNRPKAVFA